ncbi:MAG: hypothetical protein LBL18_00840 [Bacteroidales bacterium]|jgi:hypothetical protein|nr:hypothetical protein [Bacteroidales bacterium]
MKPIIMLISLIFPLLIFAQENRTIENSTIKRVNWNLTITDTISQKNIKLEKEQLKTLFSDKQFRDYKTAHRCYISSIPLLTLAACELTASVVMLGIGLHGGLKWGWKTDFESKYSNLTPIIFAGYVFGASLIPLISGVVLITCGTKKINHIVAEYNAQHKLSYHKPIQMDVSFTNSGIGVQLNF